MADKVSKKALDHPALHHLKATPAIIHDLMEGLIAEQAIRKTRKDEMSLAEYLEYLSHVEGHYFRATLDVLLNPARDTRPVESYSRRTLFASGAYSDREPEESLAHWEERRDNNVEVIENLSAADLSRSVVHPELGTITLGRFLRAWAAHDLSAIEDVAEYVRHLLYSEQ